MPPVKIAVINKKGGSGKSSTCFHLAGSFATSGLRVLGVDMDPQGSLGKGFFGEPLIESLATRETLASVFDDRFIRPTVKILELPTEFPGISILPANEALSEFNLPRPDTKGMNQYQLSVFLADSEIAMNSILY